MYREELPSETLFKMVSINAARALRRDADLGSIEKGKLADLLLLKIRQDDPYDALCHARIEDIELLTQEGVPLYGARRYKGFFHLDKRKYTDIVIKGQEKFARGNPSKLLEEIRKKVGFKKTLDFLPLEI